MPFGKQGGRERTESSTTPIFISFSMENVSVKVQHGEKLSLHNRIQFHYVMMETVDAESERELCGFNSFAVATL